MFKKGKSDAKGSQREAQVPGTPPVTQVPPTEEAEQGAAPPASEPPVAHGTALLGTEEEDTLALEELQEASAKAAEDDSTQQLMHIFTEDQDDLGTGATVFEPWLEQMTMEQVAANAKALLEELRSIG